MNPQPPVTNMRIAAPSNSTPDSAPEVFGRRSRWFGDGSAIDWTPWLIVGLAAFLRLLLLGMKPPHFDEGINGWFVDQMVKNGFYRYDPTNYHGPLHFYLLFLCQTLFGRNIWALRLPVVAGSIYCVYLTLKYEPFVGRTVSRLAALAMAVSPGFIFYGRYSIHEVWLLLFSMLFILGLLGLWRFGSVNYLWCAGMGAAGMILTKETYIIHIGCAAIAAVVLSVSHVLAPLPDLKRARQTWPYTDLLVVAGAAVAVIVFFYSGTFFNWEGVRGLYKTFDAWFKTGSNGNGHEKPWFYWLKLIGRYELPIAAGLIFCALCQLFRSFSLRYLAINGAGVLFAYSIVKYKTPWCIISIVWPLLFVFAGGIVLIAERFRTAAAAIAGTFLAVSLGSAIWLNYYHCTTDTEPYVYVQTYNDIFKLTRPIEKLTRRDPINYQMVGHMVRTSAYPFPWILGDFPNVGYYEHENLPGKVDADFLLVQEDRVAEIEKKLHEVYYKEPLRIRNYQDTSQLYLNTKTFKRVFPNRTPEFRGQPAATR